MFSGIAVSGTFRGDTLMQYAHSDHSILDSRLGEADLTNPDPPEEMVIVAWE